MTTTPGSEPASAVPASTHAEIPDLHAIVPAGGAGTRLWPLSRQHRPKFLLDLTGQGRTLLQGTWDRLAGLTGSDRIMVVTGAKHAEAVAEQLGDLPAANLVAEPSPRDSMAAIGLAAAILQHRHGPVLVASFAADHVVPDVASFHRAVRDAADAARAGYVTTIGIAPTHASTAFGYIRAGQSLPPGEGGPAASVVEEFVEKPDAETAAEYLASGKYAWNAGMFVVRTDVLLNHLTELQPPLAEGLEVIARAWDTAERDFVMDAIWPGLTKIAIDHAIAEPVAAQGGVAVVPGDFTWDDVGDWASLATLLAAGEDGVRAPIPGSHVVAVDAPGALVHAAGTVAVVGIPEAVVVQTEDALLVTDAAHAQRVKAVVDQLKAAGRDDLV
ncbi:mannose-1-phosphate guanylyltransferase [Serinibacter salmoneus]|uniref:Mannose-1-phosphate guanylyltransferase (GDP) /mannose-6-phosphate isomerase type 2 n=1 Tax=Serinibacter salmoneus TaxID=556530 RepID=A0A2A9CXB9_9MICO|nr:mannose-1-phosphate guanylyltransferase [Serinibacter salmoneus]PFG19074.1 mannose-1-phosphate guanylyltransferase (GDP) /mannose-6-phosphate isomerase type 2 [Serinibacter salmoneus]